jgi:hypothetical protein
MKFPILVFGFAMLIGGPVTADDNAARRELIEGMRRGFADAAKGSDVPNFIDILQSRFPEDIDRFAGAFLADRRAGKPVDPTRMPRDIARLFVEIQSREAARIKTAPSASLKAVMDAQRSLIQAASRKQPQLCVAFVTEAEARPSPVKEIGRASGVRLAAIFNALADGRDKPVASREASDADWTAFGEDALKRGFDVKSWSKLEADEAKTAPAPEVCAALLSSLDALASAEGERGDRLLVSQVTDLLTIDPAVYRGLQ